MTDLIARLRDADTTRRIGESYADTHERRQRDREEAADRIEQLEAALRYYSCTCKDEFDGCKARYDMMVCCGWIARAALEERT